MTRNIMFKLGPIPQYMDQAGVESRARQLAAQLIGAKTTDDHLALIIEHLGNVIDASEYLVTARALQILADTAHHAMTELEILTGNPTKRGKDMAWIIAAGHSPELPS